MGCGGLPLVRSITTSTDRRTGSAMRMISFSDQRCREDMAPPMSQNAEDGLRRTLSLWQVVLYGLGVTIGAGIYVLVGVAAGRSGVFAPLAFLVAAALLSFTALSFAELGTRLPVAASEAAYVDAGFNRKWLTLATGLFVVTTSAVSAATVSVGAAGYVSVFWPAPQPILILVVVLGMGVIASLTTAQSVTLAGIMTTIEIGGLLAIVAAGFWNADQLRTGLQNSPMHLQDVPWAGLVSTSLIAVFAFIGFEHVVNIAEEIRDPRRTLPKALFITLALTALLYASVVFIAVSAIPPQELAVANAPLARVYERLTGHPLGMMSAIAVIATLNGIIVHMIMISRVLYGMARTGVLAAGLGHVHPRTRTPLRATALAIVVILTLAIAFPLEKLAHMTAQGTLVIFFLVNTALARIRHREQVRPPHIFHAPAFAPYAGMAATLILLVASAW